EDRAVEDFMGPLAGHELDLVLADRPIGPGIRAHAFNHLLGECGTSLLAAPKLAARLPRGSPGGRRAPLLRRGFPGSLEEAPCLMPGGHATVRRGLDHWLQSMKLRPTLVAEFGDSAPQYE